MPVSRRHISKLDGKKLFFPPGGATVYGKGGIMRVHGLPKSTLNKDFRVFEFGPLNKDK